MKKRSLVWLYCSDFGFTDCCMSCHEDYDLGYVSNLNEPEPPPNKHNMDSRCIGSVCCRAATYVDFDSRKTWADALRRRRQLFTSPAPTGDKQEVTK